MKQTAVEFLIEQIKSKADNLPTNTKENRMAKGIYVDCLIMARQAKEMEKQQIIDCGNTCALMQYIHVDKVSQMSIEEVEKLAEEDNITFGEQYYEETFKNK
jgi:hypothetical protein